MGLIHPSGDADANSCRQCGYDFTGLPAHGRCPECGNYYNIKTGEGVRDLFVDQQRRTTFIVRRARTILLVVGAVLVMVCAGVLSASATVSAKPFFTGMFIAGVLLLGALTSYVYERED